MKILQRLFCAAGLMFVVQSGVMALDVGELHLETDLKVVSAYVWRGVVLNDEPCIQPSVTASAGGVSLNVWGAWDLTEVTNAASRTRMDVTLDYTFRPESGKHIFTPGITSYIYHDSSSAARKKDTFEISLDYVMDVTLLPSLSVNYDFGEVDGVYVTFGVAHGFEIVEQKWFLDLRADVGAGCSKFVDYHFNADASNPDGMDASLVDLDLSAGFPYMINDWCTLTPAIHYMTLVGSDVKDQVELAGGETDQIIYSINLGMFF